MAPGLCITNLQNRGAQIKKCVRGKPASSQKTACTYFDAATVMPTIVPGQERERSRGAKGRIFDCLRRASKSRGKRWGRAIANLRNQLPNQLAFALRSGTVEAPFLEAVFCPFLFLSLVADWIRAVPGADRCAGLRLTAQSSPNGPRLSLMDCGPRDKLSGIQQ
jgi:hypothetical protein